jgi:hypothetical protein
MPNKIANIFIAILIPTLSVALFVYVTTEYHEIPKPDGWPAEIVKEYSFSERSRISESLTGSQLFENAQYSPQVESIKKIDDETYVVTFSSEERPAPCHGPARHVPASGAPNE